MSNQNRKRDGQTSTNIFGSWGSIVPNYRKYEVFKKNVTVLQKPVKTRQSFVLLEHALKTLIYQTTQNKDKIGTFALMGCYVAYVDNCLPTFRDSLSGRCDRQAVPKHRHTTTTSNTPRRKPEVSQIHICLCGRHEGLQGLEGRRVLNLVSRWK